MAVLKSNAAAVLETLQQGIVDDFAEALNKSTVTVDAFTRTSPTNHSIVNFPFLGVTTGMKEWVDTKKIGNIKLENVAVTIKDWEDTIKISRNTINDDELGLYSGIGGRMARSGRLLKEKRVVAKLQSGTTDLGFDGKACFATDHDLNPSAVQSNNFTSTALSATNFATVRAAFESYLGSDGMPLGLKVTHLIVPPALRKIAEDILLTQFLPAGGGGNNTLYNAAELVVVQNLANEPTTWYVASTEVTEPVIYLEREAPHIVALIDPTDPNVFFRKEYLWSCEARGEAVLAPWFTIARCIA